jgi:hypothetical protein
MAFSSPAATPRRDRCYLLGIHRRNVTGSVIPEAGHIFLKVSSKTSGREGAMGVE